jgi:hypothetical protein
MESPLRPKKAEVVCTQTGFKQSESESDFASGCTSSFIFQLFTSSFSLKVFVLCLKRRTASIPALASKGNPLSARLLTNSKMTSMMTVSVMAARVSKGAGYQHARLR